MKKRLLFLLLGLGAAAGVVGFLVAASGIVPIKASSGHWAITEWFLHFSMKRSIALHSSNIEVTEFRNPGAVARGAAHYQIGCFACHGSPENKKPAIPQQMTPKPPYLPDKITGWDPEDLFYVVKHGVKFTAMPAWPARERDDAIWDMVAFLEVFPGLTAEEYRKLVYGDAKNDDNTAFELAAAEAHQLNCANCHGVDGMGRGGAFPILAGQRREYLQNALHAFASNTRPSGTMYPVAQGLSDGTVKRLAAHYASLPRKKVEFTPDLSAVELGRQLANDGDPRRKIPSCIDCHGPGSSPRKPDYPDLAGLDARYIALQLELFASRVRKGGKAHVMHKVSRFLTPQDREVLGAYYQSLSPNAVEPGAMDR